MTLPSPVSGQSTIPFSGCYILITLNRLHQFFSYCYHVLSKHFKCTVRKRIVVRNTPLVSYFASAIWSLTTGFRPGVHLVSLGLYFYLLPRIAQSGTVLRRLQRGILRPCLKHLYLLSSLMLDSCCSVLATSRASGTSDEMWPENSSFPSRAFVFSLSDNVTHLLSL